MTFTAGATMLDMVVLSLVAAEGTYGYKITQDVRSVMDVSESTLYPVLRRLEKDNFLETYNQEFSGRMRKYYKITSNGMIQLDSIRSEWSSYKKKIEAIVFGKE